MTNEQLIKDYPKVQDGKKVYVRHPVPVKNGRGFEAVNVTLPSGFERVPNATRYKSQKKCQQACNVHNKQAGWTGDQSRIIIATSMGITPMSKDAKSMLKKAETNFINDHKNQRHDN